MSVTIFASLTKSIIGIVSSLLLRPNYLNIFIIIGIFKPSDLHFIHLSLNLDSFWSLLYPVIAFEAQLLLSKSKLLTKPIFFHSLTSNSLPLHLYLLLSLLHSPLLHCSAPDSLPNSRPSIQRQTDTKEICNKWRCFFKWDSSMCGKHLHGPVVSMASYESVGLASCPSLFILPFWAGG